MDTSVKRELVTGTIVSFIANGVGKIVVFLGYIFLARWLGLEAFGIFNFVIAVTAFLGILSSAGLPLTLLRFVAAFASEDRWTDIRLLIRRCIKIAMVNSLIVMAVSALAVIYLLDLDEKVEKPLLIGLLLIPLICLSGQRQQTLRALKRLIAFRMSENIVLYAATMVIGGLAWHANQTSVATGMLVRGASALVAFAVGTMLLWSALKPHADKVNQPEPILPLRGLLAISLPLMMVYFAQRVIGLVDVAFLGALSTPEETGMYAAAARIALAASLALNAVNTIAAPMISASFKRGDIIVIKRILLWSCFGAGSFGLAFVVVLGVFPTSILSLFGTDFRGAETILFILLIGQLVNSVAGPIDFVLSMTGRQKELSIIMVIGSLVAIGLCPVLIHLYGALGAAIATTIAIVIWKAAAFVTVWFWILPADVSAEAESKGQAQSSA